MDDPFCNFFLRAKIFGKLIDVSMIGGISMVLR